MRRLVASLVVVLAFLVVPVYAQTDVCPDAPESIGGTVIPSPCVATGTEFRLRLDRYNPGQLLSVKLVGPAGVVGNMDRAMRVDTNGEIAIESNNYYGAALGPGAYEAWVKDPSGLQQGARVRFVVGDGFVSPTSLAETTLPSTVGPLAGSDGAPTEEPTVAGQAPVSATPTGDQPPRRLPDTGGKIPYVLPVIIALGLLGGGIVLRRRLDLVRR